MTDILYPISRQWAMPSKNTFTIKPIRQLIERYIGSGVWVDPFARNSPFLDQCEYSNDLDTNSPTTFHMEALDFLTMLRDGGVVADGVLFDPPYSVRQISECYKSVGREVHMKDTQSSFYGERKKAVAEITRSGSIVICFGWNSGGIGKTLGFEMVEILLVPHGGPHNDTIVTVERRV